MKINSELVKKLRAERQWSQEQLADACLLNLRTVQRIENSGNASLESLRALASVFEIDANDLILRNEDKSITAIEAVRSSFYKFADFSGSATRYEYWTFIIFIILLLGIAEVIHESAYKIVAIIVLLPFISVGVRRLNDQDRSFWWMLFFLVPYGQVVILYIMTMKSERIVETEKSATK